MIAANHTAAERPPGSRTAMGSGDATPGMVTP